MKLLILLHLSLSVLAGISPIPESVDPKVPPVTQEQKKLNERPIIGILAHQYYGNPKFSKNNLYIPASYIKLVEGGGARVAPIFADRDPKYLRKMFKSVNGILLPGGLVGLRKSTYARAATYLVKLAMKANDNGVYFPIWGECLGFQFMLDLAAGAENKLRTSCGTDNIGLSLNFTKDAPSSRLYGGLGKSLTSILATQPVTTHSHHLCVTVEKFKEFDLDKHYTALSTNYDEVTKLTFVSSVEAVNYPFYGLGFHPEKNLYEWNRQRKIPHSSDAIKCAQYFARFFVGEARQNDHEFKSGEAEYYATISNYSPEYTADVDKLFTQIYFFPMA